MRDEDWRQTIYLISLQISREMNRDSAEILFFISDVWEDIQKLERTRQVTLKTF